MPDRNGQSTLMVAFDMAAVTYHAAVRNVRAGHRNALYAILKNMLTGAVMVGAFYLMFSLVGERIPKLRGDFMLYLISGVFMYLTHIRTVDAVAGAGSPLNALVKHAPVNTFVMITSGALSSLYTQFLTVCSILGLYHLFWNPITIDQPVYALMMFLLAWLSGVAVGTVFLALEPWMPELFFLVRLIYRRANIVASGKMFVANTLPASMLALFDWNPLFHIIDQSRGFTFLNYNPHFSSALYPLYFSLGVLVIGLMGEFFTRRHISLSWSAGR